MLLRPATTQDIPALIAIMAPVIATSAASFSDVERSAEDWATMIEHRRRDGREFFVAEQDGAVVGYATYDQFRNNSGYRHTMEHSVYISEDAQGTGLGRALMKAVEDHARAAGHHSMFGGIDAENAASIAFHVALGYEIAGRLPQVGRKFERWHDLILMQKFL
ncbi:MAG: phosphinothricin acetyltransferase [Halocynthiibacter sp.]|jgi:L-amino acid N-acyltransferase YncA